MKARALLSLKQLAELFGVSTDTVRRAAQRGLIPSTREGTAYRFDVKTVCQAMERRANEMRTQRSMQASAPGGRCRPRAAPSPPAGNTGAVTTPVVTGGLSVR